MTPKEFLDSVITPRASLIPRHDSPEARCLMLAIAGEESSWTSRLQIPVPFARGFWQCEKHGAVYAVLNNHDTNAELCRISDALCIPHSLDEIFEAIAWNDTLAYWVARLALTLDSAPLPPIGDEDCAYVYYTRNWRPGRRNPTTFQEKYATCAALFTAKPPASAPRSSTPT